eukprot:6496524-Heterocapsa_arctica.AAC.1
MLGPHCLCAARACCVQLGRRDMHTRGPFMLVPLLLSRDAVSPVLLSVALLPSVFRYEVFRLDAIGIKLASHSHCPPSAQCAREDGSLTATAAMTSRVTS